MVMNAQTAPTQNGTSQWWPSKYGADDQAGALNEITPAKVLEAVRLVRQGRIYDLAHVLHQDIPAFPGRTFRQYLTTNYHQINRRHPDAGPEGLGHNSVNWIVEQVTATQQMGTHMDGLNHLQMGDRTYNGFLLADIIEDHGTSLLGIDTLPQVVTRGLLLDVAAARGGWSRLQPGDVITVADAERACRRHRPRRPARRRGVLPHSLRRFVGCRQRTVCLGRTRAWLGACPVARRSPGGTDRV